MAQQDRSAKKKKAAARKKSTAKKANDKSENLSIESASGGEQLDNPPLDSSSGDDMENPPIESRSEPGARPGVSSGEPAEGIRNPPIETESGDDQPDVYDEYDEYESDDGGEESLPRNPSLASASGYDDPDSPDDDMGSEGEAPENPPIEGGSSGAGPGRARAPAGRGARGKGELIVVARSDAGLRATRAGVASAAGADVAPLQSLLAAEGATLRPLFGGSEERVQARTASLAEETGEEVPDLARFYQVDAPEDRLEELAERLAELDTVEAAYVKPPAEPADMQLNAMVPRMSEAPPSTPDFVARQLYLNAAPVGVDARYAWTVPGGSGAGVRIIDVEWGWRFNHEDLNQNQGGVVAGTNSTSLPFENHGTAVIGEFSGDRNGFGVTGITPDANVSAVSLVGNSTSNAIRIAADRLSAGDIILLEVHRAGPRASQGKPQFGYIAIEWWPDDFAAIRYAVAKGVLVVEAAGNGGQNLDDAIYDTNPGGFPASWRNPFNPANPSSEAVVVGAGMPPPGTHGRNAHPSWGDVYADRGRCFFSNHGARVDAQGWGWEVTSTGYGDLQGGTDRDQWYTDQFSGTSSASPVVVGVLASLQGILRARGQALLTPAGAIAALRATGSAQQSGPAFTFLPDMTGSGYPQNHPARPASQRIGNRPDLRELVAHLTTSGSGASLEGPLSLLLD